jgi:hypothetical protein
VIEMIPVGTRLIDGLLQGVAVRASGFAIVPLSAVAPAVKYVYQSSERLESHQGFQGVVRHHDVHQRL